MLPCVYLYKHCVSAPGVNTSECNRHALHSIHSASRNRPPAPVGANNRRHLRVHLLETARSQRPPTPDALAVMSYRLERKIGKWAFKRAGARVDRVHSRRQASYSVEKARNREQQNQRLFYWIIPEEEGTRHRLKGTFARVDVRRDLACLLLLRFSFSSLLFFSFLSSLFALYLIPTCFCRSDCKPVCTIIGHR